ncbi:MAG: thioredoxin domain-containing protein [Gammaproteobacteria bacterium]|nr:thioredoxin domain-containing protein [Gammaproteobacteria bacterium]
MRSLMFFIVLSISLPAMAKAALQNRLGDHPSPYLAMHGQDPVKWQSWDETAFKASREQDKLLFVSSGYFSCHWCHVMQRESYQNPEIAAYINEHFIPVKVDRELNPALDAYLINFLENTQGYSGWPLNAFITPEGHPLVGLVYLPPGDFKGLMEKLVSLWQSDRSTLKQDAARGAMELARQKQPPAPHRATAHDIKNYHQTLMTQVWQMADELQGGFGQENKFPMAPQLHYLMQRYDAEKDKRLGEFLELTLDHMATQGLRDQIGGGFYRYVVDPGWQVPHFEKMLYDNALLASLYFDAATIFQRPDYRQIALETVDFMLREMWHEDGAFIASLSAVDDKNVEGGYYLWQEEELKQVLSSKEYEVASRFWKLNGIKPLDEGYHAVQATTTQALAEQLSQPQEAIIALLDSSKKKLFAARQSRVLPKDDKRLAAWNGLSMSALSRAVAASDKPRYRQAAEKTAEFLTRQLWDGKALSRAHADGKPLGKAGVEDYALAAQALQDWSASNSESTANLVKTLQQQAWKRFYDQGWQRSEAMFLQYGNRDAMLSDDVLPSPSATLIRLGLRSRDKALRERAEGALRLSHEGLLREPFWYVGYLAALAYR